MGIQEGTGQLNKALGELMARWNETQAAWNDAVSRQWEERFLVPLQADLKKASTAMGQMAVLLDRIRRDCT